MHADVLQWVLVPLKIHQKQENSSDEFEPSQAKLKGSQAKLKHFIFRAETKLTKILSPN